MALPAVGNVTVSRVENYDGVGGFTYHVTFVSNVGDLQPLDCRTNDLVATLEMGGGFSSGNGLACDVVQQAHGNFLGGRWRLEYTTPDWFTNAYASIWTSWLPWDASETAVKNALEFIDEVGIVDVNV